MSSLRIQLFNPPVHHYQGLQYRMNPPLGLPILSAVLRQAGHECEVVDLEALGVSPQRLEQAWAAQRDRWPDVVGFTALTSSARGARESIAAIRRAGYTGRVIVGGPYATLGESVKENEPTHILAWGVDTVVMGECEGNIVQIIEQPANAYRGVPLPIEQIPAPDWSHHAPAPSVYQGNAPHIGQPEGIGMWSRGCPHSCLVGDTLIATESGAMVPIKDITAGMRVWGVNLDTGIPRLQQVHASMQTSPYKHGIMQVEAAGGYQLTCTHDHQIWTRRGWIEAGNLTPSDEVLFDATWKVHRSQERDDTRRIQIGAQSISNARSTSQGATGEAGARIQSATGQASAAVERQRHISPQVAGNGGRAQSAERTNASRQSREAARGAREDSPDSISQEGYAGRTGTATACRGQIWGTPADVCRGQTSTEPAYDRAESYEESRNCCQGSTQQAVAVASRPERDGRGMDSSGRGSEQGRSSISRNTNAAGLPVCGGRGLLDRPLSEWNVPQPGLHLQERTPEDRATAERGILAPEAGTERYTGDGRLHGAGLADAGHIRQGTEQPRRNYGESEGLVGWAKVLKVTPLTEGQAVYDLETWPDHNFFANRILVHNCIFCGNPVFGGQRKRFRPPAQVIAEMADLKRRHIRAVFVYDDELVGTRLPEGWLEEVSAGLAPLGLVWKTQGRCSRHITPESMALLYQGGCRVVMWGVESFSQKVLDATRKGITVDDIWHTLRAAKAGGIQNWVFTQIGQYQETDEDARLTAEGLAKAYGEGLVDFRQTTITTILPATPLESLAKEQGWYVQPPESGPQMHQVYQSTPWLSAERIAYWQRRYSEVCPVDYRGKAA